MNFDLKPSSRVLSRLLIVRDFNHSFIWRSIGPGESSDGDQPLKTLLTFIDILNASSRVTGIILSHGGGLLRPNPDIYISLARHVGW